MHQGWRDPLSPWMHTTQRPYILMSCVYVCIHVRGCVVFFLYSCTCESGKANNRMHQGMHVFGWQKREYSCCLHLQATPEDTAIIINMLQDISARLNVVETKVSAGGVNSGGGATPAAATSMSTATLEQMRAMLRQQGSGSYPCIFHLHMHNDYS